MTAKATKKKPAKPAARTGKKSGAKSGARKKNAGTFKKGKDPRRGRGPKPGTGGRPPDEFKRRMRELASSKEAEEYLERCLRGEFGPKFFLAARQDVADRGYGKPVQAHEVSGTDGEPIEVAVTHRIIDASAD